MRYALLNYEGLIKNIFCKSTEVAYAWHYWQHNLYLVLSKRKIGKNYTVLSNITLWIDLEKSYGMIRALQKWKAGQYSLHELIHTHIMSASKLNFLLLLNLLFKVLSKGHKLTTAAVLLQD